MSESQSAHASLQEHFRTLEQQHDAANLGMWVFLITEVMFFGLFMSYTFARYYYPDQFAIASHYSDPMTGAINTAVLLCSSLTMALAVHASQIGWKKGSAGFLAGTALLGCVFLVIKGTEWYEKFKEHKVPGFDFQVTGSMKPVSALYFSHYFAMTGLHALHMIIGVVMVLVLIVRTLQNHYSPEYHNPVDNVGLYWHFVDIIWIFLFPLFYLIDVHH